MLRITVDLIPYGDEQYKRIIDSFEIANDGTGNRDVGNYKMRLKPEDPWQSSIQNHPRHEPVLKLVYLTLKQFYGN